MGFSSAVAHKTLSATAAALQDQVLSRTQSTAQRLAPWSAAPSPAEGWLGQMRRALDELNQARAAAALAADAHRRALAVVESRLRPPIEAAERAREAAKRDAEAAAERIRNLGFRLRDLEQRGGPLRFIHRWRANRCRERLAEATPLGAQTHAAFVRAEQDLQTWNAELRRALDTDPAIRRTEAQVAAAEAAIGRTQKATRWAAQEYARLLAGILAVRPIPDDANAMGEFVDWCGQWHPVLQQRARLLDDWQQQLAKHSDQLHDELIQYADVIGTTCIGAGIRKNRLSDLDFDLAIVDEAGQIPLTTTLVPLVRARRAILVGDHKQLPPFVDDDVRQWLARRGPTESSVEPGLLTDLLARSAFERLIAQAPSTSQVVLRRQRRMPAVVADFASAQFYGGKLATATEPGPPSPVFRSPLALIDTSDIPPRERAERTRARTETWQAAGCDNLAEAQLVLDLVQWYARHDRQWAVIAPYRAQVQLLDQRLRGMLGDTAVRDRVGTVDAFQGKEYDIVVYSFTRSNAGGRVGFLRELRRLNVAITRAREQLVLVGDFSTLVRADDPGFRHLAGELYHYSQRHGDIVASRDLRDRLACERPA
ncbi:hypothetical protein Drose_01675 [Dactylosporangium roseum]|uniref:DNA helicase n=1 Tax=Dactylosporangium roseum TaxID=47989 RepID=A0ABY5Z4T5_9ACTN|nr:DEAD/DEAH box helicase [Dactylosporangium roseum]UWZ37060.1 hypothetical protein Drose_01675 [Dactylosporangium roseum]